MADPETTKMWEDLREELMLWQRLTLRVSNEVVPVPSEEKYMLAPWWWHAGLTHDPSEPEPKVNLILTAIIWELALEAMSKDALSETSTTLLALKKSRLLQEVLEQQAERAEHAGAAFRAKSAKLGKG